ncbi:RING-H2 finger protein ATL1-like [Phragmites australis]|uniref:RING-H2 finger protein ATL1-like n=1 Tax=Phragmites australis TaxID=29695 RepID=UPI002D77FC4F|nr:RING-H2 finger protein ATL1-like [Phragmites australis]
MDTGSGTIFPMPQIPALLFPPPPPPLPSYFNSYSSSTSHHPSITSFPILVLTVLGILTTSVLLLTYYVFVIRCCLNWHGSSDMAGLISRRRGGAASSSSSSTLPVSGTPAEARGLKESAIQALPTFRYRKAIKNIADSAPTSECAVCLSEFEEEERVRMLPSCLHAFHVDCIDTWLQGNANCPLCRAAITSHCLLPLDQLRRSEEVVIQVVAGNEEEEDTQAQQQEGSIAAAGSAGDATTDQQVSSEKRKSNNAWHNSDISSKGDECIGVRKDRDVLPLRRSFSMGSLGGGEVHLQIQKILQRNTHFHGDDSDSSSTV